ncbi:bifunctional 2-C-methyl-D-erythritol 4-phosphate cytidylyltransferase/2-C-methyl-D-erythritol 2,4-cyclodiphosphate synthase [Clavibacter sepedonicus]|uniref:Bifunctional enzyme IspD/IspF n=1 Tax=Clavibacter sepedonicus TaxID=31964 RepID=B0RAX0_CLASE|nr:MULTISPECIES: bifunctional 2-C-methyl-D-erythritol 4-phosphate cytidylyltransferase/2-C-methyl-D-erythritol 2,4-cyclodiphosphate synthase [Clavibacter]MBD5380630.1 bifunctional 2-C-methyl-D-erythritol 4-phosphate cytidylyltransferase/2-C-methyl-D-erythritol 2,4-cyclodiphosphate synthase [Clavibacter sp.]OQJ48348.1 bifunctional 2-C-methyl-D-erythritol 4-phosphate cytidylyltransferase/2-C-methyl-D-erythritol 2,4-cyclodiphosphate synthase [Clavibacter sepedonicus]OQJ53831.1 bifunctional 2-C-meth
MSHDPVVPSASVPADGAQDGPRLGVVVVAAGSGTRLGAGIPKALVEVGGATLLARSLGSVLGLAEEAHVVVVAPETHLAETTAVVDAVAGVARGSVAVVVGGATRQGSVAAGLAALAGSVDTVLVHDAARALTPAALFAAVAVAVRAEGAGIVPGLPVTDTVKRLDPDGECLGTVDRSDLVGVQTPQGFPRAALDAAYARADAEHTDDAALFQASGGRVRVIPGDALAFKVTTAWDLRRAEELVARDAGTGSAASRLRSGIGTDVHATDATQPLWLAGLHWPGQPGLAGHSDGDAVSHAMCDALLSAAGLGDIGGVFGTDDPELDGAHGEVFLRRTAELVRGAGYRIVNVAVQVMAVRPKLSPRRAEAERILSAAVGAPVSLAGTTTDGLGFTGRGDGVAAVATALVERV